jgi:hypothetical protein
MTDCVHHWLLDSPEGELIVGKCRNCGAERDWPNTVKAAEGRPFILRDPLLPRIYNTGYGGPRPQDYWN